jgi:hypothetical protein
LPEISPQIELLRPVQTALCLLDNEDIEDAALMASNALDLARLGMPR